MKRKLVFMACCSVCMVVFAMLLGFMAGVVQKYFDLRSLPEFGYTTTFLFFTSGTLLTWEFVSPIPKGAKRKYLPCIIRFCVAVALLLCASFICIDSKTHGYTRDTFRNGAVVRQPTFFD